MKNIAIFASGSGTNAENIARIFNEGSRLRVAVVLTNRRNAGVIERMKPLGVPVLYVPNSVWDNDPAEVVRILREYNTDIVVLAGFMHYVSPEIIAAYQGRIMNIHPSLLPAYGGKGMYGHYVHEAVVAAGEKESGVTVHLVTDEMDKGEIILQERLTLAENETPESLEAKIHPIEYDIYPRAIVRLLERLNGGDLRDNSVAVVSTEKSELSDDTVKAAKAEPSADADEEKTVAQSWAEALGVPLPAEPAMPPIPEQPLAEQPASVEASGNVQAPSALNAQHPDHPMPPTYMLWAILATVMCCLVTGIVAIVFASQVSNKYYAGDFEGAERASRKAQIWIIASIVAGVIFTTLYMPLSMLF